VAWDELLTPGVELRPSAAESERFGLRVVRVSIGAGQVDVDELQSRLDDLEADVAVVRYDAARLGLGGALAQGGRLLLPAGSLTYWDKPALPASPGRRPDDSALSVVAAREGGGEGVEPVLRALVRASFADYGNHYTANPLFDNAAALDGYEEWAVRTLGSDPGNVLVLAEGGEPIGAATLAEGGDHVEVLLAGLVPAAQGRRLYGTLLRACEDVAVERGLERLVISTQVHNVRVQRAWARAGLRPLAAVETVHLVRRTLLDRRARH